MMWECRNLFNFGISMMGLRAAPGKMFEVMLF